NFGVLFCDIRGFSQKSETMSAVENFSFVNQVFGVAGPIIREYDGFIDKYIGDAVMALFPDVTRSVRAGIKLYNALTQDEATRILFDGEPIAVGVGIHTGTTMIGIVGEHMRLSGTVISDTVNLASRLEGITKYYKTGMVISKDVAEQLSASDYTLRWLGAVKAAGLRKSCEIYEVLECLPPDVLQKRLETRSLFERSLHDFHAGNVAQALAGFSQVLAQDAADTAARMYAEYIASAECTTHSYIAFSDK
ncbi:adenylate/guanylate cyclase domain-containing protein, partial [Desulfovibrio sp. OttesenSCG-928-M14]|nr:adenylate/guanylate cyclase domain-containing protein [Desulfovibrio sp. OttesenSCG-928-M14]